MRKKKLLLLGLPVILIVLFFVWNSAPRTVPQIFPDFRQADACQIVAGPAAAFSDIRLEGEAFRDFAEQLENLKCFPIPGQTGFGGAAVLDGIAYTVIFYAGYSFLGQIDITDVGIVAYSSRQYEIRDPEAVSRWNDLMKTYGEREPKS